MKLDYYPVSAVLLHEMQVIIVIMLNYLNFQHVNSGTDPMSAQDSGIGQDFSASATARPSNSQLTSPRPSMMSTDKLSRGPRSKGNKTILCCQKYIPLSIIPTQTNLGKGYVYISLFYCCCYDQCLLVDSLP